MNKPEIIIPTGKQYDTQYGKLTVVYEGGEIVINKNHEHLHSVFVVGRAVQLTWKNFNNKDYVDNAVRVGDELPEATDPRENEPPEGSPLNPKPPKLAPIIIPEKLAEGQEEGMWINNLGARIGDGSLMKAYPKDHVKIEAWYWKRMFSRLDIKQT